MKKGCRFSYRLNANRLHTLVLLAAIVALTKRDPVQEDRIYSEAIVDARPEEQAMRLMR